MKTFNIFFNDLKPEVQEDLIKTFGLSSADEMNWELVPVATVDIEDFDDEFNHIDDCVDALMACKTIDEVHDLLDNFPRKFGEWWVDVVSDGVKPCYEVTNQWWDSLNEETNCTQYQLEIEVEDED